MKHLETQSLHTLPDTGVPPKKIEPLSLISRLLIVFMILIASLRSAITNDELIVVVLVLVFDLDTRIALVLCFTTSTAHIRYKSLLNLHMRTYTVT